MKNFFITALGLFWGFQCAEAAEEKIIRISTDNTVLVLQVAENGRLYQTYLGEKLLHESDLKKLDWQIHPASDASVSPRGWEVCSGSGNEDFFEPALGVTHADGNASTWLYYVSSSTKAVEGGTQTDIHLRDDKYPVNVTLHYVAYEKEDVIKTWSEISHQEKKPVQLFRYASTMLYFNRPAYYLTEFSGDWAKEVQMSTQKLEFGKKVVDTKLGSRAAMHAQPFFMVGLDTPAAENQGEVLMGTLGWTGNFSFTFEVDNVGNLRVIPAINPYASVYELQKGEVFTTPEFIFTLSNKGTGEGSRRLQNWARNYQLKDGKGSRLTLLNNWENTGFGFNQNILVDLIKETKELGVDMFLLDDGWFGNKYKRSSDTAGLGDWDVTADKLPDGINALVQAAEKEGVKFGLWIEPEMVNPKSELFEKYPDWAIHYPNRETYYYRNQLVLDLSNPKVQDYVYCIVDKLLKENPGIAYFKWDCNSPITNIYSSYLKDAQGRLYIDHVRGVYNVMKRVKENYPDVPMMLCSGGGARCDYEALKYFTEFWPSDNTDAVERIFIQWGYSYFFPAKSMAAHVTSWGKQPVKFRTDVASMCKLGFDIRIHEMSQTDQQYCKEAVANFKRLDDVILDGDQYRLQSPYESQHAAVMYANDNADKAVLFAFDIHPRYAESIQPLRLQGLKEDARYELKEINLVPGTQSRLACNGKTFSGEFLMNVGIPVFSSRPTNSHVIEITEVK